MRPSLIRVRPMSVPFRLPALLAFALAILLAVVAGATPRSAAGIAFPTNPIHVLDLGIVLPAFVVGGVALVRRRPLGYWLAPTMLGFGVLMEVALIGMVVSIRLRGTGAAPPIAGLLVMLPLAGSALVFLLRRLVPRGGDTHPG